MKKEITCLCCGTCCRVFITHVRKDKLSQDMRRNMEWRGIKVIEEKDKYKIVVYTTPCKHQSGNLCSLHDIRKKPTLCVEGPYNRDWLPPECIFYRMNASRSEDGRWYGEVKE